MDNNKFDFKCIFYTNNLISVLVNKTDFNETGINPENLRYIILQLSQSNYENTGNEIINEEQYNKALEKSHKDSLKETLDVMLKDGLIEISGIDDNGEYIMELTKTGKEIYNKPKDLDIEPPENN